MDPKQTPIYITNYNNLERGFRRLLLWLRQAGHTNVIVLDNASTWPPLLEFYASSPELNVVGLPENRGPYALWHLGWHEMQEGPFVVTDPDVVPAPTCPNDLVAQMVKAMETLPATPCKVGPSLRVDNLPDHYRLKREVVAWERQWWQKPTADGTAYDALIDTTMALYRSGSPSWPPVGTHYRLAPPYQLEHVPWYEDIQRPTEEARYYREHIDRQWTHWTRLEEVVK